MNGDYTFEVLIESSVSSNWLEMGSKVSIVLDRRGLSDLGLAYHISWVDHYLRNVQVLVTWRRSDNTFSVSDEVHTI